jgi:glycosyltransferase involved in cell wall biosynthesis
MTETTIKIVSVIEATTVNGAAKVLLGFCREARSLAHMRHPGLPRVETTIITFDRSPGHAESNGAARDGANSHLEGEATNEFIAAARSTGVEVDVIRERFRFDLGVIAQLRRIIERRAPDIIETQMVKSHFLVKMSGLARRYPWVAYHHGYTTTDLKMRVYNQLNRWSLPSASRVITVCGPFREQLAREGVRPEKIAVRHNSITAPREANAAEVAALRRSLGISEMERIILAVGRLSREKGHVDLIHALEHLRRLDPELNFKLVVVGEGPERPLVEEAARRFRLDERVCFAGQASDVRPFYQLADVLALPSHSEGSPNVLLEAMAAGVPVAATAVGGVPEIADDEETALLVAARDAAMMAGALHRLLTDGPLAAGLAARAREHVLKHFSPDAFARSLIEIYSELAQSPPARGGISVPAA